MQMHLLIDTETKYLLHFLLADTLTAVVRIPKRFEISNKFYVEHGNSKMGFL